MNIEITPKGYFSTISQFKFIKDLGIGSFGRVKLAIHRSSRKNYAIKIIQIDPYIHQSDIQLIVRQIKLHSKLEHPHIIKLWDTFIENNKIFMIMDYAKNGSLFKYHTLLLQNNTPPSEIQKYQFFYQTLQAIKYLHSHDIMHRDIKPENILLDEEFNIKLCDFGWATCQITNSRNTFCGTYQYMAPEMVLQKSYDYRIDIWALGILLFQLQHGKAPFQAENLKIMKQKINKGSYQIDANCDVYLKQLIVGILQFIPQKRFAVKDIEEHPWVKQHLLGIVQNYNSNIHQNNKNAGFMFNNIKRKHQHQKSMGDFPTQVYNLQYKKMRVNNKCLPSQNSKIEQPKKHKRNITQPNSNDHLQFQNSIAIGKSGLTKKVQIALGTLNEDSTNLIHQSQLKCAPLNTQKPKIKCKTQGQEQFSKIQFLPNTHIGSRRNLHQDQISQIKKKKLNILVDTNLANNITSCSYTKNIINTQKQNEIQKQKGKKKHKLQQKTNLKVKKIQDKLHQMSTKIPLQKSKDNLFIF